MKRICKICGENPATVPDRNTMSMRKVVCSQCHRRRLAGDLRHVLHEHEKDIRQGRAKP